MEPLIQKVETEGQGQWPVIDGVGLPDTRLGPAARWGRVSPLWLSSSSDILSYIFTSTREARIIFKAGKNRDGYFDADDLLRQVDKAIDIFEGLTKCYAQGLFLFDNAPSHQKRAPDAISARHMVKGASMFHALCWHMGQRRRSAELFWTHMHAFVACDGAEDNSMQSCPTVALELFYFTDFSHRTEGRMGAPS